jgi:hypothetical protein
MTPQNEISRLELGEGTENLVAAVAEDGSEKK